MDENKVISICDSFEELAGVLADFLKNNTSIYLKCQPEIVDFRKDYNGAILLLGKNGEGVQFSVPKNHFTSFIGILTHGVFGGGKTVYTWDIKKLFSYLYYRWPRKRIVNVLATIVDLKYGETFLGIEKECPMSFEDAENRGQLIVKNDACWNVHHRIHIPLATRVLPKVETVGLCDLSTRSIRYASYMIEGQAHGRLRCREAFPDGLLIHNLNKEEKEKIRPSYLDNVFAVLDYKAMEVCVLHWLSKDERLGKIISSGRDIYSTIYSLLYGLKCTSDKRQLIKDSFLPVVYGLQSEALSTRVNITKPEAVDFIKKISTFFNGAMGWVQSHVERAKRGEVVCDQLGRPRTYEDKPWVVRNAIVQGPAAVVCQEKLISLWDAMADQCDISANRHDDYVLDVPKRNLQDIIINATSVLEEPSAMCPGLTLRVGIKVGTDLANLTTFNV